MTHEQSLVYTGLTYLRSALTEYLPVDYEPTHGPGALDHRVRESLLRVRPLTPVRPMYVGKVKRPVLFPAECQRPVGAEPAPGQAVWCLKRSLDPVILAVGPDLGVGWRDVSRGLLSQNPAIEDVWFPSDGDPWHHHNNLAIGRRILCWVAVQTINHLIGAERLPAGSLWNTRFHRAARPAGNGNICPSHLVKEKLRDVRADPDAWGVPGNLLYLVIEDAQRRVEEVNRAAELHSLRYPMNTSWVAGYVSDVAGNAAERTLRSEEFEEGYREAQHTNFEY